MVKRDGIALGHMHVRGNRATNACVGACVTCGTLNRGISTTLFACVTGGGLYRGISTALALELICVCFFFRQRQAADRSTKPHSTLFPKNTRTRDGYSHWPHHREGSQACLNSVMLQQMSQWGVSGKKNRIYVVTIDRASKRMITAEAL